MTTEKCLCKPKREIANIEHWFWQQFLRGFYSRFYREGGSFESPVQSINQMVERIIEVDSKGITPQRMIDIGSGAQYLISSLINSAGGEKFQNWEITTIDFAHIPKMRLKCNQLSNVSHKEQSATTLPFPDNHFGLAISNFAIDLLPPKAIKEVSRVLVPGGQALFNFHYPSLIYERVLNGWKRKSWNCLNKIGRPFRNEEQIIEELLNFGLVVTRIKRAKTWETSVDDYLEYWEVDAKKV